jgi:thioredoxin-like negative regulator of GroEL
MATLQELLNSPNQSVRLKAALAAGTYPNSDQIEILISQCANESDFFVRDTLSWALMRHDQKSVVEQLKIELKSENPQARSQALHTLSKIGDKENYELITRDLLLDPDDFVASTAWRSASVLVSDNDKQALVELLISQLGRGDSDVQFGLTRFLCAIGQPIVAPLTQAAQSLDEIVRTHAEFTLIRFQEMELEKVKKK